MIIQKIGKQLVNKLQVRTIQMGADFINFSTPIAHTKKSQYLTYIN